jgi:NADH-quinone oxidoreductase subunit I
MFKAIVDYFREIIQTISGLWNGMRVTGKYIANARTEIITREYPDNREELQMFERFRGEVILLHNEDNEHRCTGCSACEVACPNGSIEIIWARREDPETGKKKKQIETFVYHLSMCTMCNLCILACPTDAIKMGHNFEHAVFDRSQLTKVLNRPGSKLQKGVEE